MKKKTHAFEKAGLGKAPFEFMNVERRSMADIHRENGMMFVDSAMAGQAGSTCDFCGTGIVYQYWIKASCGSVFKVGCECVRRLKETDPVLVQKVNKARKKIEKEKRDARKEKQRKIRREEANRARKKDLRSWVRANRDLLPLLKGTNRIVQDIRARLIRYPSLSDAQIGLLKKIREQENEKRGYVPSTNSRISIKGKILKTAQYDEYYGTGVVWKMTLKIDTDDGTYRLFGSIPLALREEAHPDELVGKMVQFEARVTRSDRDPSFGFISRPTKAKIIG